MFKRQPDVKSSGVAVLWDYDNVRSSTGYICQYADTIISYAKSIGIIKYLGCSAVWSTVSTVEKETLVAHGFELIQNPKQHQNATDLVIADQIMDILKQKRVKISDYVLVTNDKDFIYHIGLIHAQRAKVHLITSQKVKDKEFLNKVVKKSDINDLISKIRNNHKMKCYATQEWKNRQEHYRTKIFELYIHQINQILPKLVSDIRNLVLKRFKNPPPKPENIDYQQFALLGYERWKDVHLSNLLQPLFLEYLSIELQLPLDFLEDIMKEIVSSYQATNSLTKRPTNNNHKKFLCEKCNKSFKKQIDLNQHAVTVHELSINS